MEKFEETIGTVRRRLKIRRGLRMGLKAAFWCACGCVPAALVLRRYFDIDRALLATFLGGAVVVVFACSFLLRFLADIPVAAAAAAVDRMLKLPEVMLTAIACIRKKSVFGQAVVQDARTHSSDTDPARVVPFRLKGRAVPLLCAAALMITLVFLVEPVETALQKVSRKAGRKIEDAAEAVEAAQRKPRPDLQELKRKLKELSRKLKDGEIGRREAVAKMDDARKMMKGLESRKDAEQKALESLGRYKRLQDLARSAGSRDIEEMMKQAEQLVKSLEKDDGKSMKEIEQALREAAELAEAAGDMQDVLKELEQAARLADLEALREALGKLASSVRDAPWQDLDAQSLREALEQLAMARELLEQPTPG